MRWSVSSVAVRVAVRVAVLGAVSPAIWLLVRPDHGWGPILQVLWTLGLGSLVWAAVDGVRNARRGASLGGGLLVWALVAGVVGPLQLGPELVGILVSGGSPHLAYALQPLLFWTAAVALPALGALVLAHGLTRALAPRPDRAATPAGPS